MKLYKYYVISLVIIVLDQVVKLTVHEYMLLGSAGEISLLGDWFKLHYTLNEGMAFGIQLGSEYGKLALTLFRWVAMIAIAYYILHLYKQKAHSGFIWCISLILAGAVGNVIDSTFYGVFLENAPYAENPPPLYPWFHGQVVDMFYFDIWQGRLPEWLPFMGGQYYSFWPIFNVADASIFLGVTFTLIFQKRFFPEQKKQKDQEEDTNNSMIERVDQENSKQDPSLSND